jgi:hypothetical protein
MSDRQRYESEATQGAALGMAKKLFAKGNMYYCQGHPKTAAVHYQNASSTLKIALDTGILGDATADCYVLAAQCYERLAAIYALSALSFPGQNSPKNIRAAKETLENVMHVGLPG